MALPSQGWDNAVSFLVKLAYLPSRPWYCCYRSIHPHQLDRSSSCLVPFQGILTPPLVSQGGRPELNIESVVSLSSSPPNASHPFASLKRPPIIHPYLPSLIHHCHHNTRFRPGVRALTLHTVFLPHRFGGKHAVTFTTEALWLHSVFIQTHLLVLRLSQVIIKKKGNEPGLVLIQLS